MTKVMTCPFCGWYLTQSGSTCLPCPNQACPGKVQLTTTPPTNPPTVYIPTVWPAGNQDVVHPEIFDRAIRTRKKQRQWFVRLTSGGVDIDEDSRVHGEPHEVTIGSGTSIAERVDINGKKCSLSIGQNCDIAANVTINCSDSSRKILFGEKIERLPIVIGDNVYVGDGAKIFGGTTIGHHTKVCAGAIVKSLKCSPWSKILPGVNNVLDGHYQKTAQEQYESYKEKLIAKSEEKVTPKTNARGHYVGCGCMACLGPEVQVKHCCSEYPHCKCEQKVSK